MLHVHPFQQHDLSGKIFYKPWTEPDNALTFTFTFSKPLWILLEAASSDLTKELYLGWVSEVGGRTALAKTLLLPMTESMVAGNPASINPRCILLHDDGK